LKFEILRERKIRKLVKTQEFFFSSQYPIAKQISNNWFFFLNPIIWWKRKIKLKFILNQILIWSLICPLILTLLLFIKSQKDFIKHKSSTWHLSMKESSLFVLFCLYWWDPPGCFRSHWRSLWKALNKEGCMGLVPWRLDLRCKSSRILNDFFTANQLKS